MERRHEPAASSSPFDALPLNLLRHIMLALPVDARGRAACVCRAWRDVLADAELWKVLDLSSEGGLDEERITENLVRAAAARAAGLRVLNLGNLQDEALAKELIAANGATLRVLHAAEPQDFEDGLLLYEAEAFLTAAPHLEELHAPRAVGGVTDLAALLRTRRVRASCAHTEVSSDPLAQALDFVAAVREHVWLERVFVSHVRHEDPAFLNAVFEAACTRRLTRVVTVEASTLRPAHAHALARLLRSRCLTQLDLEVELVPALLNQTAVRLGTVLRHTGARSLKVLTLSLGSWQHVSHGAVMSTLMQLVFSLEQLILSYNMVARKERAAAGRALGALIALNSPTLTGLYLAGCQLGDEGVAALLSCAYR